MLYDKTSLAILVSLVFPISFRTGLSIKSKPVGLLSRVVSTCAPG